jgi:transposase
VVDCRYASAWLHAAIRPGTDEAFALITTEVGAATTQAFLDAFAATLPEDTHAALLLDGAGWHTARSITIPDNVSLVFLPPYSPELNPVERVWLHLRERYLSLRLFADLDAVIEGCRDAWNRLLDEPGRIASLTDYPIPPESQDFMNRVSDAGRRHPPLGFAALAAAPVRALSPPRGGLTVGLDHAGRRSRSRRLG